VKEKIPAVEWPFYAPLIFQINRLKKKKDAVILAHNYQTPQIFHGVADITGDSLQLAIEATKVTQSVIVQCGAMHFWPNSKSYSALHDHRLSDLGRLDCQLQAVAGDIGNAVENLRRLGNCARGSPHPSSFSAG